MCYLTERNNKTETRTRREALEGNSNVVYVGTKKWLYPLFPFFLNVCVSHFEFAVKTNQHCMSNSLVLYVIFVFIIMSLGHILHVKYFQIHGSKPLNNHLTGYVFD